MSGVEKWMAICFYGFVFSWSVHLYLERARAIISSSGKVSTKRSSYIQSVVVTTTMHFVTVPVRA